MGPFMEYVRKARRNFIFTTPDVKLTIDKDGVSAEDGTVRFSREKFKTKEDCLKWISENMDENVKLNKSQFGATKSLEVTPADFEVIRSFMKTPDEFQMEDVRVYEDYLCHNLPDRDAERFMPDTLKRFNETIVGKQRLIGHNWSVKGTGRYYDSRIVRMNVDQALEFFGKKYPSKNPRKIFQKVVDLDGSVQWLVTKYFVPSFTMDTVELDMGIGGDSSIGFSGVERRLYEDGDFRVIELHPRDDCEALEGSDVGVPAQPGAGTKDYGPDNEGESGKDAETPNTGGKSMDFKVAAFEIELPVTEENLESDVKAVIEAVEAKAVEMQENVDSLTSEIDTLKSEVETGKAAIEEKDGELKALQAVKDELFNDLVEDLIKVSLEAELFENTSDEVDRRRKIYASRSVEELKMDRETAIKAMDKKPVESRVDGADVEGEVVKRFMPEGSNRIS